MLFKYVQYFAIGGELMLTLWPISVGGPSCLNRAKKNVGYETEDGIVKD